MSDRSPLPPVLLPHAVDDPDRIAQLIAERAPYRPVQRYMANRAEYATLSGGSSGADPAGAVPVAPVFRGDWAFDGRVEPGVEPLLRHETFIEAARTLFGAEIVRPHTVYVNLTWQIPFPQGRGHVDIPTFRGFDRTTVPVTFLTIIGQSGLFEAERVKVATAVSWFYRGSDGGFEYWPDGPEGDRVVLEGDIFNTAVVGDNDFMWHRVRAVGRPEDGMASLSLDSELVRRDEATWGIVDGSADVATFEASRLRVSLSWKADVFADEADRRRHDNHDDDLSLDTVFDRIRSDLASRGLDSSIPTEDPLRDPSFISRLQDAYMRYPA